MTFKKLIGLLPLDEYITVFGSESCECLYQGRLEDLDFKTWIKIKLVEVYEFFADKKGTPAIFITVKI